MSSTGNSLEQRVLNFVQHQTSRRTLFKAAGAAGLVSQLANVRTMSAQDFDTSTFVFGSAQDITTFDPHMGYDYSIIWGLTTVYDSLLQFGGIPLVTNPLVATEVTPNEDASVWTAKLDPAAVFPDGSPINGEVIQWNVTRLLTLLGGPAWMFADVLTPESVVIVDDATVEFQLTKPFAPFNLTLPYLYLMNPAEVEANAGEDNGQTYLIDHAPGSGPYTITRLEVGSIYEFTRREDYWHTNPDVATPIQTFYWQIFRESSTKRIAMEAGEVHYGDYMALEDVEALGATEGFVANPFPSWSPFYVKMNNQIGPTADLNVRKALAAATDYEATIAALNGRGTVLQGPLPERLEPWWKSDLPLITFDMDAAKEYLAQSEYPDGFDLEYIYVTDSVIEQQVGLIMLEKFAELGINLTITPLLWPDLVASAADPNTAAGMYAIYSGGAYLDPDAYLFSGYHSSQAGTWANSSQVASPELDALLEQARASGDPEERKALYDQAQLWIVENQCDLFVFTEIASDVWVSQLGENGLEGAGSNIRNVTFSGI